MDETALIKLLLKNRGLSTTREIDEFFHPPHPETFTPAQAGLSPDAISAAIQLIKQHIDIGNQIIIYGDYDVDGLCSTAILWETLEANYRRVLPYIPHRRQEGYGLSRKGIDAALAQGAKLLIAVDNGIVAHEQIAYCRSQGCDVVIIDHHEPGPTLPAANVVLHSTATCAAALAYFFTREFLKVHPARLPFSDHLGLAALATVCDIVPLLGLNRSLVKYGLQELSETRRPGLLALFSSSGLTNHEPSNQLTINSYHAGFVLGPRLNASGRLEHALDSLRLLCTRVPARAKLLAAGLSDTNRTRQDLTAAAVAHALENIDAAHLPHLLIVQDTSYDEGIIGLIAAKLVEKYHRPAIAIAVGESISKASARSIAGFNITDHIRTAQDLLISVGGHAMASGFTVATPKLGQLHQFLSDLADTAIDPRLFISKPRIDAEIPLSLVTRDLLTQLQEFEPHGLGNPHPVFSSTSVPLSAVRTIGSSGQHLKFIASGLSAVYFQAPPDTSANIAASAAWDLIYRPSFNTYNGTAEIQLVIQSLTPSRHEQPSR